MTAHDLVRHYHLCTEIFDRLICTGHPDDFGGIMPANADERAGVNDHARIVLRAVERKARYESISFESLQTELRAYARSGELDRDLALWKSQGLLP